MHPKYFHPGEYFYHKGMTRRGPFPSVRALPPVGAHPGEYFLPPVGARD
jgi:hypothetical protein